MKQKHPPADDLVRPEELPSTQNLTALVAHSLNGSAEPHHEATAVLTATEVHAAPNGRSHRNGYRMKDDYKIKYGRYGEIILAGINPLDPHGAPTWIRVITLPRAAVRTPDERKGGDGGWSMREWDRPTFPFGLPAKHLRWRLPGPKQAFKQKVHALRKKLEECMADTDANESAVAAIREDIKNLTDREEQRRRTARRQSVRKRPIKADRKKAYKPRVEGEESKKKKKKKSKDKDGESGKGGKGRNNKK